MTTTTISAADLESLIARALEANNTSPDIALSVALALTAAEVDGHKGHGLSRVPSYAGQAGSGKVDGHAKPAAERVRPGLLRVDAANGFAYPAFDAAFERLPKMAAENGIAVAAITRSHHCGVAGWHVERLADSGLVAILFANTPKAIAPWGGNQALYGTNPVAFAAPREDAPALVIDLATSQVARGLILKAAQAGEPIPEGWALDADGNPTTDAEAALTGTMQPLGGAKGAALALMIELMAAALTGAHFGYEASSFFTSDGPAPGVGQLVIAIDPDAAAGRDGFAQRLETIIAAIEAQDGVRLPGTRRLAGRAKAVSEGVTVDSAALERAEALARGEAV